MSVIARLIASLTADTTSFESGMKRASRELTSFANVAKVTFESEVFKGAFDKLAEGIKELTYGSFEAIDATAKQARSLGESVRDFQAQSAVAKAAGVDQESYARAVTLTEKALYAAAEGSKKAQATFSALGLNVQELIRLSPDQQFEKIATALSKIQNPTERTALALQVWGRNGRALIPMLDDFKNRLEEVRKFQDEFNISLTQTDARKVEEAKLTFDHVKEAVGGLGNTIAVYFAPLVTEAGQALLAAGVDGTTFSNAVQGGMKLAAGAVDLVRQTVLGLGTVFLQLEVKVDQFVAYSAEKLATLSRLVDELPFVGKANAGSSDYYDNLARGAREDAAQMTQGIAEANTEAEKFVSTMDKFNQVTTDASTRAVELEQHWKGMGTTTTDAFDNATKSAGKFNDALDQTDKYAQKLDKQLGSAFNNIIQGAFNGTMSLKKLESEAINILSTLFQEQAFGGGSSGGGFSFGSMFSGIGSFFSGIFGGLPSFDVGTDYVPHDMIAQIHKGEAIVPAGQNRGGDMSVTIINNSSANVSAKQVQGPSGPSLKVMIDEATSQTMADPRSRTRETLQATHGIPPLLTQR